MIVSPQSLANIDDVVNKIRLKIRWVEIQSFGQVDLACVVTARLALSCLIDGWMTTSGRWCEVRPMWVRMADRWVKLFCDFFKQLIFFHYVIFIDCFVCICLTSFTRWEGLVSPTFTYICISIIWICDGSLPENACSSRSPSLSSLCNPSMENDRVTQNSSHSSDCLSLRKTRPRDRFPYVNSWIYWKCSTFQSVGFFVGT